MLSSTALVMRTLAAFNVTKPTQVAGDAVADQAEILPAAPRKVETMFDAAGATAR